MGLPDGVRRIGNLIAYQIALMVPVAVDRLAQPDFALNGRFEERSADNLSPEVHMNDMDIMFSLVGLAGDDAFHEIGFVSKPELQLVLEFRDARKVIAAKDPKVSGGVDHVRRGD